MADDTVLTVLLKQLDAIARAPMTAAERESRARNLLEAAALSPSDLLVALSGPDLRWNREKAEEYRVPMETWLRAVEVARSSVEETAHGLLRCIRRAASAAEMLRAGYEPRLCEGGVTWARPA